MKKKNLKNKVLFLVLLACLSLQSCYDDGCDCGPQTEVFFDIQGFNLTNYKVGKMGTKEMKENDITNYSDYLGLKLQYNTIVSDSENANSNKRVNRPFTEGPVCDCDFYDEKGSINEKLDNLTVVTLNDFDHNHLANDTINDIVSVRSNHLKKLLVDDYLKNDTILIKDDWLYLDLEKAPEIDKTYKVKVIVELSTGEKYEEISTPICFE